MPGRAQRGAGTGSARHTCWVSARLAASGWPRPGAQPSRVRPPPHPACAGTATRLRFFGRCGGFQARSECGCLPPTPLLAKGPRASGLCVHGRAPLPSEPAWSLPAGLCHRLARESRPSVHLPVFHVDVSAPCLSPGFMWKISAWTPPCLSKCSRREGAHKCPHSLGAWEEGGSGCASPEGQSTCSAAVEVAGQHLPAVCCWAEAGDRMAGGPPEWSPGVGNGASRGRYPTAPLEWWPEGGNKDRTVVPVWGQGTQAMLGPRLPPAWAAFADPAPQALRRAEGSAQAPVLSWEGAPAAQAHSCLVATQRGLLIAVTAAGPSVGTARDVEAGPHAGRRSPSRVSLL